jgi:hypothetical protein
MRQTIFFILSIFFIGVSCNNKEPFKLPYDNIGGYVIGNETCNADATQNYWLLDFTVYPNSPHIGDTLTLNGNIYTNVLKVKGLGERLKQVGMRVSIDYNIVTANKVITKGCTVSNPITYDLKEISIINQGEIR